MGACAALLSVSEEVELNGVGGVECEPQSMSSGICEQLGEVVASKTASASSSVLLTSHTAQAPLTGASR